MGNRGVLRQLRRRVTGAAARGTALQKAVRAFLKASGADLRDPELAETPERVARTWQTELLDGYGRDPGEELGRRIATPRRPARELVVVTGLRFHSICPHHLLPWTGVAHLAYVPDRTVVGFGRLSALLDALAHRLVLQESLAEQVATALHRLIPARGAACILEGAHDCLRLRGARQRLATTYTEAYEGTLGRDRPLRKELWHRIEKAGG